MENNHAEIYRPEEQRSIAKLRGKRLKALIADVNARTRYENGGHIPKGKKLTQEKLAELVGVDANTISRYAQGRRLLPEKVAKKIVDKLDGIFNLEWLLGRADERYVHSGTEAHNKRQHASYGLLCLLKSRGIVGDYETQGGFPVGIRLTRETDGKSIFLSFTEFSALIQDVSKYVGYLLFEKFNEE